MSLLPRPYSRPSRTRPPNGSTAQPSPGGTTSRWPFRCTTVRRDPRPPSQDVHTRIPGRMLGTVLGDEIPHVESAVPQPVTEHVRAGLVGLSRRIKGRDPHQIGRKSDDLVGRRLHLGQDSVDQLCRHLLSGEESAPALTPTLSEGANKSMVAKPSGSSCLLSPASYLLGKRLRPRFQDPCFPLSSVGNGCWPLPAQACATGQSCGTGSVVSGHSARWSWRPPVSPEGSWHTPAPTHRATAD